MKLLLNLIMFSILIFPQSGILKGRITDVETGKPLIGASINILAIKKGAATINEGEYFITKVDAGKYDISASYPGYKSIIVKDVEISREPPTELNLSLPRNNSFQMPEQQESFYLQQIPKTLQHKLLELKKANKTDYYRTLQETYFEYILQEDKTSKLESEVLQTDIECKLLAANYKKATDAEKTNIYKELEEKLNYQFELKQKLRLKDLSKLSQKIETLKNSINNSKTKKEFYINNTLNLLLKN